MKKYIEIPIGSDFLSLADRLVELRDTEALETLHRIIGAAIINSVIDTDKSLIEVSEYIDVSLEEIKKGSSSSHIRQLSIRKLLDS